MSTTETQPAITPGDWYIVDEPVKPLTSRNVIQRPASIRSRAFGQSSQMGDYQGVIVCTFDEAHGCREHAYAECWANARVLSVSSALYKAAKRVLAFYDESLSSPDFPDEPGIEELRRAIAKAEGRVQ